MTGTQLEVSRPFAEVMAGPRLGTCFDRVIRVCRELPAAQQTEADESTFAELIQLGSD